MKKKLATLLTVVLCVSSLAACGQKQTPAEPATKNSTEVSAEASTEASVEESTEASTEASTESVDLTTASREYTVEYVKDSINPEDGLELSFEQDGVSMTMGVQDGESKLLYLVMEKAIGSDKNQSAFYVVGDDIYMCMGSNDNYVLKTHSKDVDGTFTSNAEESTGSFVQDTDKVADVQFVECTEYEGTYYDVVKVATSDDDSADYYYNKETGKLEYIKAIEDGQEAMISVKPIEEFVEPDWFKDCEEQDSNGADIMMQFMSVMLMPMIEDVITEETVESMTTGDVSVPFDGTLEGELSGTPDEDASTTEDSAATEATSNN